MKSSLFPTLKNYKKEYLGKDIAAGIMIAAVSIPISMGYAQIAGLPAVCGSIRIASSFWTVWFCASHFIFCTFFHITAIYFWSRCGTGGHCGSSTGESWN